MNDEEKVAKVVAAHRYLLFPGRCSCSDQFMTSPQHIDHLTQAIVNTVGMSGMIVGNRRLSWEEAFEFESAERRALDDYRTMLSDLSRNEHGRRKGDADIYDPTGTSRGNPHLETGSIIGYSIHGTYRYVVPRHEDRHDIKKWKVRNT